jgi:hypothetical protein
VSAAPVVDDSRLAGFRDVFADLAAPAMGER